MERKQGLFSALREEVARGLSRSENPSTVAELLLPRRWRRQPPRGFPDELLVPASRSLAPLAEGPEGDDLGHRKEGWGRWVKGQLSRAPSASCRSSDLRFLLGVTGAPLAPVHVSPTGSLPPLSIKDAPIETSTAQYILQQYTAATGGLKLLSSIRNAYATGKVTMVVSEFETASRVIRNHNSPKDAESGGFVLWQMAPGMWYVELAIGGSKVHAGCNGKLVWRRTPWLGAHAATGPVRPLRRALQGLDPLAVANVFADARCIGEKKIDGEDCFILKLCADPQTLKARSDGCVEIIRHVFLGYFSQKTGLLTRMEDSHLTRIQSSAGGDAVYWETTINSRIDDYRAVEGTMIAHSGHSQVTLFRFGEVAMGHTKTRMEEVWSIEEVAFNVPGLSMDCFIPPADVKDGSVGEAGELSQAEGGGGEAPWLEVTGLKLQRWRSHMMFLMPSELDLSMITALFLTQTNSAQTVGHGYLSQPSGTMDLYLVGDVVSLGNPKRADTRSEDPMFTALLQILAWDAPEERKQQT